MNISMRAVQTTDLHTLQTIGYETYNDTFKDMNTPETMEQYLSEAFDPEKLLSELNNPHSRFFFLYLDDELAGYLKVNDAAAQSDVQDPASLEIERIYVRRSYHGRGLGRHLMDYALDLATREGKRYAWLGVWEKNSNAIAFYQKMDFEIAGKHSFRMGDEIQSDYVMKRSLA